MSLLKKHVQIRIESWSNSARTLIIQGMTETLTPIEESHTTNADRSIATNTYNIDNMPKVVQVSVAAGVRRGECYVRLTLLIDGKEVECLSAGYLTDSKVVVYPPGLFEDFHSGKGYERRVAGTNPAAGDEISEAVPTNAMWILKGVLFTLVTDATVINRRVALQLTDGAQVIMDIMSETVQAASLTRYYRAIRMGYLISATGAYIYFSLPVGGIKLRQGWTVGTNTDNLQAGDDFGAPVLVVEELLEE